MDARNPMLRTVAILVIMVGWSFPVYADLVYTYSGNFNLPIPAPDEPESAYGKGWMDDAVINITDHIIISDLDVSVNLTHESFFDLQILLQSPAKTNVVLNLAGNLAFIVKGEDGTFTPIGGSRELFFDDEAELSIEEATEPFVGPFRPVWSLSSFDKENAYGYWRLRIYDMWDADIGTLNSFELMITTPEPATAILLILGAGLITVFKPRRGR